MQLIDEPLSQGETDKLKRWLDDPAFDIFIRVVESQAFRHEVKAAEHVIKGTQAAENVANNDVLDAQKCRHVLTIMRLYRAEKNYKTARAVPTITSRI